MSSTVGAGCRRTCARTASSVRARPRRMAHPTWPTIPRAASSRASCGTGSPSWSAPPPTSAPARRSRRPRRPAGSSRRPRTTPRTPRTARSTQAAGWSRARSARIARIARTARTQAGGRLRAAATSCSCCCTCRTTARAVGGGGCASSASSSGCSHRTPLSAPSKVRVGEWEGRRDGGTEGRRGGGTEGRRDGGKKGRREEGTGLSHEQSRSCMAMTTSDHAYDRTHGASWNDSPARSMGAGRRACFAGDAAGRPLAHQAAHHDQAVRSAGAAHADLHLHDRWQSRPRCPRLLQGP